MRASAAGLRPTSRRQTIDQPSAISFARITKAIVKTIKDAKVKVQASIQSDQVRVVGRSKDDLQRAMTLVRETDYGIPLQFTNYRG